MPLYNFDAARSQAQREKMKRLDQEGVCIFCPEHVHSGREKVDVETEHWMVKKNDYPYEGTRLHILLIPKLHVPDIADLPKASQDEFVPLIVDCVKFYKITGGYALAMRSGDMRHNGGSIEHLHAHIIVGDIEDPDHQPVKVKLTSRPS